MARFTEQEYKDAQERIKKTSELNPILTQKAPKQKKQRTIDKGLIYIKSVIKEYGLSYTEEYRFTELRRWKFDIIIDGVGVAIEYEGIKSAKSRHTTITGYTGDADKYNYAAIKDWTVLRYTVINYHSFELDLLRLFYNKKITRSDRGKV